MYVYVRTYVTVYLTSNPTRFHPPTYRSTCDWPDKLQDGMKQFNIAKEHLITLDTKRAPQVCIHAGHCIVWSYKCKGQARVCGELQPGYLRDDHTCGAQECMYVSLVLLMGWLITLLCLGQERR